MTRLNWFPVSVAISFAAFMAIMIYVVVVAAQRKANGSMGIDAAKIQQMRVEANQKSHTAQVDR